MSFGTIALGAAACCESEAKSKACTEANVANSVDCTGCTIDGNQICEYDITGGGKIAEHDYPCKSGTCENTPVDLTAQTLITVHTCATGGVGGSGYSMIQIVGGAAGTVIIIALCGFCCYRRQAANTGGGGQGMPPARADPTGYVKFNNPPPPGNASLPPGWTQDVDPDSGQTFYTNPQGVSTWELPR